MHFDWTISIGNLVTISLVTLAAIGAWKDLTWRISNLETWRKEHMLDACARDAIIEKLDKIIDRWDQRDKDREDYERKRR